MRTETTQRSPKRQLRRDYWYVRLSLRTIADDFVSSRRKLNLPPERNRLSAGEDGRRGTEATASFVDLYTNTLLASPEHCKDLKLRFEKQIRRALKKANVTPDAVDIAVAHSPDDDSHVRTRINVKVIYYVQQFFVQSKPSRAITKKGV